MTAPDLTRAHSDVCQGNDLNCFTCRDIAAAALPLALAAATGVTFLTWDQLCAAMKASCDEYETRFAMFLAASQTEIDRAEAGLDHAEASAESASWWAACKAQSAMTGAIAAEMRTRQLRKDYGPTATEAPGE